MLQIRAEQWEALRRAARRSREDDVIEMLRARLPDAARGRTTRGLRAHARRAIEIATIHRMDDDALLEHLAEALA